MAVPFRIGVMQLTMEPLDEMLASARAMDEAGMDTVWLAEAYPWWRKHQMEARGSTVVSALMARETKNLTIAWGIISPYTRHPVQVAMDARVVQEAAGPGRFIVGFGTSKIFLNNTKQGGPPEGDEAARAHARLGRDRARHPRRRAVRVRRQGVLRRHSRALGRGPRAPLGRARVRGRDGAADAADRRRDRRRAPDARRSRRRTTCATPPGNIREGAAKSGRDPGGRRSRLHDPRLDPRRPTATPDATAPARSAGCTSRTRCRTSRARPTCCSSPPASTRTRSSRSPRRWRAAAGWPRRRW